MNKETAKDLLPLVQALADGKTIQLMDCGEWFNVTSPDFFDIPCNYRIKPEPREWKACVSTSHHKNPGMLFHYDEDDEEDPKYKVIRVREILD